MIDVHDKHVLNRVLQTQSKSFSYWTCSFQCFLSQDLFVKRTLKRIREKITEKDMWVEGQFCSETDMKEFGLSEILCLIHRSIIIL